MVESRHSQVRCGIILAAGEGKRLQPLIRRLWGEAIPKQYVNFIGERSMLEHTFGRAEKLIPPDRLFTVVGLDHLDKTGVWRQLSSRPRGTVVVQPENKETAPGLLLPLMHLYKHYPESVVVIFPSDHFILEEDLFMDHVDRACRVVERDPSRLILLGIEPDGPESEYGYVLPIGGSIGHGRPDIKRVSRFIEKPERRAAGQLLRKGALWNTMVIVFKAKRLLDLARKISPTLYQAFRKIRQAIGTPAEMDVVHKTYRRIEPMNFSRGLLEILPAHDPSCLWVLPVRGVHWSDWGSEQRVLGVLRTRRMLEWSAELQSASP